MHGLEAGALVERRPALALADGVAEAAGLVEEELGVVRGREALEEDLHRLGQAVVDLVAAGPEGVAARRGERVDLEHGVVRGDRLKRDVAVPPGAGEPADVRELVGEAAALLLLLRGDDAGWCG